MIAEAVIKGIKEKQDVVKQKLTDAKANLQKRKFAGAGAGTPAGGAGAGAGDKATTMDQVKAIEIQVDVQELSTISAAGTAIISTEKASAQAILRNV